MCHPATADNTIVPIRWSVSHPWELITAPTKNMRISVSKNNFIYLRFLESWLSVKRSASFQIHAALTSPLTKKHTRSILEPSAKYVFKHTTVIIDDKISKNTARIFTLMSSPFSPPHPAGYVSPCYSPRIC